MRFLNALFITVASLIASAGFASSILKSAALPLYENGDRSFVPHSILGPVCSSMKSIRAEPACNPALLGEDDSDEDRSRGRMSPTGVFGANLFFGDDYETLYKNRDLISGNDKHALAQSLLSQTEPVRFEGSILMWWRGERTAVSYQPMRWTYYSDVRNQAYPDVAIHGMQEQSLQWQMGGFLTENWRAGLQVRALDRKFVHEEFNLFSAIAELENHLVVKSQRALFIEPGVAYEVTHGEDLKEWRPLFTFNLSQAGFVDRNYDETPVNPILDGGFSLSPPVAWGEWDLGLNYRWTAKTSTQRKLRFGTLYRLGLAEFLAGIDQDEWSLGLLSTFRSFSAGLMYRRMEIQNFDGVKAYQDSGFVEFRLVL